MQKMLGTGWNQKVALETNESFCKSGNKTTDYSDTTIPSHSSGRHKKAGYDVAFYPMLKTVFLIR